MTSAEELFRLPEVQEKIRRRARKTARHSLFNASDLDDIFQDLSLHLYRRLPRYRPQLGELSCFVHVVLLNRARTLIRQQERRLSPRTGWGHVATEGLSQDPVEDRRLPHKGRAGTPDRVELQIDLERVVSGLTPIQQAILQAYTEGRTITEIAQQLTIPRSTLSGLLKKLQQRFTGGPLQIYFEKRRRFTDPEV